MQENSFWPTWVQSLVTPGASIHNTARERGPVDPWYNCRLHRSDLLQRVHANTIELATPFDRSDYRPEGLKLWDLLYTAGRHAVTKIGDPLPPKMLKPRRRTNSCWMNTAWPARASLDPEQMNDPTKFTIDYRTDDRPVILAHIASHFRRREEMPKTAFHHAAGFLSTGFATALAEITVAKMFDLNVRRTHPKGRLLPDGLIAIPTLRCGFQSSETPTLALPCTLPDVITDRDVAAVLVVIEVGPDPIQTLDPSFLQPNIWNDAYSFQPVFGYVAGWASLPWLAASPCQWVEKITPQAPKVKFAFSCHVEDLHPPESLRHLFNLMKMPDDAIYWADLASDSDWLRDGARTPAFPCLECILHAGRRIEGAIVPPRVMRINTDSRLVGLWEQYEQRMKPALRQVRKARLKLKGEAYKVKCSNHGRAWKDYATKRRAQEREYKRLYS